MYAGQKQMGAIIGAAAAGYADWSGNLQSNAQMIVRTGGGAALGYEYPIRALGMYGSAAAGAVAGYMLPQYIQ